MLTLRQVSQNSNGHLNCKDLLMRVGHLQNIWLADSLSNSKSFLTTTFATYIAGFSLIDHTLSSPISNEQTRLPMIELCIILPK